MPTLKQHLACIWTDGAESLEVAITWLAVKKVTRVAHLAHLGSVEEMSGFEMLSAAAMHSLNEAIEARLFPCLSIVRTTRSVIPAQVETASFDASVDAPPVNSPLFAVNARERSRSRHAYVHTEVLLALLYCVYCLLGRAAVPPRAHWSVSEHCRMLRQVLSSLQLRPQVSHARP